MSNVKRIELLLSIGEETFAAVSARIIEGMSELGGAWVEVSVGTDLDLEAMLEEDGTLTIAQGGFEIRRFTMRLASCRFIDEESGHLRYELEFRPAFWFARLDKNIRKFRDQRTEEIVSTILGESSVPHAWKTTRQSASRPYEVQYRETNLDFVSRLLEFEGFYYTFDTDGTMIIADASGASPEVEGGAEYTLIESADALSHGELGITYFERGAAVAPGKATVNDYNWKTPAVSLLASATGAKDTQLEVYDYPVGYRDPGTGQMLAQLRVEALTAQKRYVEGKGTVAAFGSAHIFAFAHEEAASFSGRYCLVRVEHTYREEAGVVKYENAFRAIPASVPFRPALVTPRPTVDGNHTAMVRGPAGEEIHTDQYGRAKVQFHWDREGKGTDEDSRWIRMNQEISTSIALCRVGWEVSVGYIDGDPTRPIGLARQINGQMVPTYQQPSFSKRMTIKTETYPGKQGHNELRMEDSSGAMTMDWHAQKDWRALIENDRTESVGNNLTVFVEAESSRTVEKNQQVSIGGNQTRNIGGNVIGKVELDRSHSVGGNEQITSASEGELLVTGNDVENVGGSRISRAGTAANGAIDRAVQVSFTRIVGGSSIALAGAAISHEGGESLTEIAGGTKLTVASEQSIKQSVADKLGMFVSGFVLRKSQSDMSVSAKKTQVDVGASAVFTSAERVELRGKEIEVVASASITLKAGGLEIAMTPGEVALTGPLKKQSGSKIVVRGNAEKLTP